MGFWAVPRPQPKIATTRGRQPLSRRSSDLAQLERLASKGCASCPLDKARLQHPKMLATGPKRADVYILGEAPGADEDETGIQFVGKSGKLLRESLPNKAEKQIRWNNVINCRPPGNREPAPLEVACCRQRQVADIELVKPKLILGFGGVPLRWFTGQDKITTWRGRLMPVRVGSHSCWFAPIFHPSYVSRAKRGAKGQEIEQTFYMDIDNAFAALEDLPEPHVEDAADSDVGLECIVVYKVLMERLAEAMMWSDFAIDIETNGLRPHRTDPKILSVAISNYDKTFSWPMQHRDATWTASQKKDIDQALKLLILGRKPIAHNSKFEQEWLSHFYGDEIVFEADWQDTMAQAYVLDEREGTKSLEFCTMSRLGINVKSLSKINAQRLEFEPFSRLLPYNGYDSKYTYLLYYVQQELVEKQGQLDVYKMCNSRAGPLAIAERRGVMPDPKAILELNREYQKRVKVAEAEIQENRDVKEFNRKHGRFNPASSGKDLPQLFHKQLGCAECKVRDKRPGHESEYRISTDESVLSQIDRPIAKLILNLRGIKKSLSTYIAPFSPEGGAIWPDKLIHANFHHLLTSTTRLSCSDPNLQNFPIRKEKHIRAIIRAPEGYWLVSFDFGQIEARVIAMASLDEFLVKALWEGYDVHMEWAERVSRAYPRVVGGKKFLHDKEAMKEFRQTIKNGWVFPLFFGSAIEGVADTIQVPRNVLVPIYDEFWDTFEGVHVWQEQLKKEYRQLGYVAKLTGGRRHAPMGLNELINSPIQGTAADIVNEAFVRLSRRAYEEDKPQLQFVMQIHDDLTMYILDKLLEETMDDIAREMVRVDMFPFVNVPLTVEVSVGSNWANKEEVEKYSSVQFGHKRAV